MILSQAAVKLRAQIMRFSGNLSLGLSKPASRFVSEAIYGICSRQSVHLTEIGRALEESIPLIKTENRLSRNLSRVGLRSVLQESLVREGSGRIGDDTLLVLDLSDIVKPYAKKMEYLARVRDGSADELANGYWLCHVVGVETGGHEITPMYGELYSQEAADFVSENDEIHRAIKTVSGATSGRGIWVLDRGGDRRAIYDVLLRDDDLRFIIRQRGDRKLLYRRNECFTVDIARNCPTLHSERVVREEGDKEKACFIHFGFMPVRLPEHPDIPMWLVVVKGFGKKPLMLLTNIRMSRSRKVLWRTVSSYLTRWRIEETIRFGKQCYRMEDVRVMTYDRLRNMVTLVTAAMFFTAVVLGSKMKLSILASHAYHAAKRVFGIPDFRYYALSDGIREILTRFPGQLRPPCRDGPGPQQHLLWDM